MTGNWQALTDAADLEIKSALAKEPKLALNHLYEAASHLEDAIEALIKELDGDGEE